MKKRFYEKSAKAGYTAAFFFFLIAFIFFLCGWNFLPTFAGAMAVALAIYTARAHGHLSKKGDTPNNTPG